MLGFERRLNALWYGQQAVPWLLRVLERGYAWGLQRRAPISAQALAVPVLVVGNFTVGGTGKTPLIIAIVSHLQKYGLRVGVVSRGYGRKTRDAHSVNLESRADQVGDEPLLIAKRTQAAVRVDADRLAAAKALIASGCQVIVSDDGLQHRRLPRQFELEVFDKVRGYGNRHLLPAGPLREVPRAVDMRVSNGAGEDDESAYAMRLQIVQAVNLGTGEKRPLSAFAGQAFTALAGIGNPQRFFDALNQQGLSFDTKTLPDHHPYQAQDIPLGTVLMTEKDAVKCSAFARAEHWAVPADAQLSAAFYAELDARLAALGVSYA
jgi:tetraacyldisaccharide 4'-kinase